MNAPIYWFLTFVLQCAIQVESNANCSTNDVHALILARGGSKGITYKNLVQIDGLSILSRAITTISNSSCFKHIWVSTDDEKIALEAKKFF
nr:post-translational flagellin modification protein B isoform X3 [Drosophila virilis]